MEKEKYFACYKGAEQEVIIFNPFKLLFKKGLEMEIEKIMYDYLKKNIEFKLRIEKNKKVDKYDK